MTDSPADLLTTAAQRLINGAPEIADSNIAWNIAKLLQAVAGEMGAVTGTEYEHDEFASWDAAVATARAVLGQDGQQ